MSKDDWLHAMERDTTQQFARFDGQTDQNFENVHGEVLGINNEVKGATEGLEEVQSEVAAHSAELDKLKQRMDKLEAGEVSARDPLEDGKRLRVASVVGALLT